MSASFQEVALLLYYQRSNRYSFNALVGALETCKSLDRLPIYFVQKPEHLTNQLEMLSRKFQKVILGFSMMTYQKPEITEFMDYLKRRKFPNVVFIAGGPHPTGDTLGTLKLGFDIIVRGEGEEAFSEIVDRIRLDRDYKSVKGVAFLAGEKCVINPQSQKLNLDLYPPFAVKHRKFGPIEITRGCPWTCRFCQTPYIFGVRVRHRSVSSVSRYVRIMKQQGLTDIRFISPNAFMYGSPDGKSANIEAIAELLHSVRKAIGRRGRIFFGTFPSEVRPESVTSESIELVKEYCNNNNLVIGAQSGSERILERICRGHGVEDIRRAVRVTVESGLKANVDIIFGLPGETAQDIEQTLKLVEELTEIGARIHAHTFMPLAGTPFQNEPPGILAPRVKEMVEKLISAGRLYGQWRSQELIAERNTKLTGRKSHATGSRKI